MKRILLAAGGTGGHVVPAVAVADALKEIAGDSVEILFVGTGRDIEARLVRNNGYELVALPAAPFYGEGIRGILHFLRTLPKAYRGALELYTRRRPDVVVGFGGFPSVVPVVVACCQGIPVVIHESNVSVGAANRLLSLCARRIFAVNGARGFFRSKGVVELPNPVRRAFYEVPAWTPFQGSPTLVVLGGSQGAVSLNDGILSLLPELRRRGVRLIHQTGSIDFERMKHAYEAAGFIPERLSAFLDDIPAVLADAHIVISRAGAMAVGEILAAGRPAVFVPLPIAGGHQRLNALLAERCGAAEIVEHGPDFGNRLTRAVTRIVDDPQRAQEMAQAAEEFRRGDRELPAMRIARAVLQVGNSSREEE